MKSTARTRRCAGLARHGLGYVLAILKRYLITTGIGARPAIKLARPLPARAWQRLSAGPGAKGPAGTTGP
jgi:hypothetical protein